MQSAVTQQKPGEVLPVTQKVAEMGQSYRYENLPAEAVQMAKHCFLDWVGVTLAGSRQDAAIIMRETLLEQGGKPQSTLLGSADKTSMQHAALINGTASHILDFDDVAVSIGHPSVPVFPALLALAETRNISGRDFITAFVAGIETEGCVGTLVAPGHYAAGWHSTATLGTFGAAAACAHVLHLDQDQWLNALGIAGTQAAGLKSMFGTMCKSFHAGKAAANGLLAATLAARGFTSNQSILEDRQGFGKTQTTTYNPEDVLQNLGEKFYLSSVHFKKYASCAGTHPTIEGVLRLKEHHSLEPEQVKSVKLRVPTGHNLVCNIYAPETPLEGKFSLRFTAALALAGSDLSNLAFTEKSIHDPTLVAIRDRVIVELLESENTEILITLMNGIEVRTVEGPTGPNTDKAREWKLLVKKFRGLAIPIVGEESAGRLIQAIERLEESPSMTEFAAFFAPAG